MKPNISIIIPCYNFGHFLPVCLDSILVQKGKDVTGHKTEIICINDCSNDNLTPQVLETYSKKYKNIKVLNNDINMGVAASRNTGIDHSIGQNIIFIDADDFLHTEYNLQTLYNAFYFHPEIGMATGNRIRMNEKGKIFTPKQWTGFLHSKPLIVYSDLQKAIIWRYQFMSAYNTIYDANLIRNQRITFDTDYTYFEDCKFVMEYLLNMPHQSIAYASDATYVYRKHSESAINKMNHGAERNMRIIEFYNNLISYHLFLLHKLKSKFGKDSIAYDAILKRMLIGINEIKEEPGLSSSTQFYLDNLYNKLPEDCIKCKTDCSKKCLNNMSLQLKLAKLKKQFSI